MERNMLLSQLKAGNYRIEMQDDCGCYIYWQIENEKLIPDISTDCCWVGNVLYVENTEGEEEIIAEQIAFEPFREVGAGMTTNEFRVMLEENDLEHIINDMQFDENKAENHSHYNKLLWTLVDYIEENEYITAIYYSRGFANEYDCVLAERGANIENAEIVTPAKWAKMYLSEGNALTQMYIGFKLLENC